MKEKEISEYVNNDYEWILDERGITNIKTNKFIPKYDLREDVGAEGVDGCLVINSFLYGVKFIPSNEIKFNIKIDTN